ncbi:MAG: integrase [Bacteroidales bacterium]|nr:integrase [Bacteroidales bacterium]
MKRNLPTITPILYTSKTLSNGEHPIMLRVCYNGKRTYKSIGISCKPSEWSKDKNKVKGSRASSLNTIITRELTKANDYVLSLEGKDDYTAATIVKYLSKSAPTQTTLFSLFEERITFFKVEKQSHNNAVGYRTLLNRIKKYTNNVDLELFEITPNWLSEFEEYLRCHYSDNSIRKFFDCFKAIFNYAKRQDYIKETPFSNFTFSKKLNTQTRKRALTIDEITKLMKYYYDRYGRLGIEDNEVYNEHSEKQYWVNKKFKIRGENKLTPINAEQFSLALYLTSYLFQGLALVDIANLKLKDLHLVEVVDNEKYQRDSALHGVDYAEKHKRTIQHYDISTYRAKTHHHTRIVVRTDNMMPYLNPFGSYFDDYCQLEDEDMERYLFPIFDHNNDSPEVKFERMTYMNYLVNVNLKRIAKRLGMAEITFYSARHSYASQLYHANVPIGLIAQNMGRNPSEIQTYLKEFDTINIVEANNKSLIVGQDLFKEISAKEEEKHQDEIREALKAKGDTEGLERYEAYLKWKAEH